MGKFSFGASAPKEQAHALAQNEAENRATQTTLLSQARTSLENIIANPSIPEDQKQEVKEQLDYVREAQGEAPDAGLVGDVLRKTGVAAVLENSVVKNALRVLSAPVAVVSGELNEIAETALNRNDGGARSGVRDSFGDVISGAISPIEKQTTPGDLAQTLFGDRGNEPLFRVPGTGIEVAPNDVAGFAGEIYLDPLTYLGGVGKVATAGKAATKAADAATTVAKTGLKFDNVANSGRKILGGIDDPDAYGGYLDNLLTASEKGTATAVLDDVAEVTEGAAAGLKYDRIGSRRIGLGPKVSNAGNFSRKRLGHDLKAKLDAGELDDIPGFAPDPTETVDRIIQNGMKFNDRQMLREAGYHTGLTVRAPFTGGDGYAINGFDPVVYAVRYPGKVLHNVGRNRVLPWFNRHGFGSPSRGGMHATARTGVDEAGRPVVGKITEGLDAQTNTVRAKLDATGKMEEASRIIDRELGIVIGNRKTARVARRAAKADGVTGKVARETPAGVASRGARRLRNELHNLTAVEGRQITDAIEAGNVKSLSPELQNVARGYEKVGHFFHDALSEYGYRNLPERDKFVVRILNPEVDSVNKTFEAWMSAKTGSGRWSVLQSRKWENQAVLGRLSDGTVVITDGTLADVEKKFKLMMEDNRTAFDGETTFTRPFHERPEDVLNEWFSMMGSALHYGRFKQLSLRSGRMAPKNGVVRGVALSQIEEYAKKFDYTPKEMREMLELDNISVGAIKSSPEGFVDYVTRNAADAASPLEAEQWTLAADLLHNLDELIPQTGPLTENTRNYYYGLAEEMALSAHLTKLGSPLRDDDLVEFISNMSSKQKKFVDEYINNGSAHMIVAHPDAFASPGYAEAIARTVKMQGVSDYGDGEFWQGLAEYSRWWKAQATLSPGFSVRNTLSTLSMNAISGGTFRDYREYMALLQGGGPAARRADFDALQPIVTQGRTRATELTDVTREGEQALQGVRTGRRYGPRLPGEGPVPSGLRSAYDFIRPQSQYGASIGRLGRRIDAAVSAGLHSVPAVFNADFKFRSPVKTAKNLGSPQLRPVEEIARGVIAYSALGRGESLDAAIDLMHTLHFDYSDLSKMERVIRDYAVPFYTFRTRNFPLVLELLGRRPAQMTRMLRWQAHLSDKNAHPLTPEYYYGEGNALTTENGDIVQIDNNFSDFFGLANDVAKGNLVFPKEAVVSSLAPWLKLMIEIPFDEQAFSGAPIVGNQRYETKNFLQIPSKGMNEHLWKWVDATLNAMTWTGMNTDQVVRRGESGWEVDKRVGYFLDNMMPLHARVSRLLPSEPKYQERGIASWLGFMGLPYRKITSSDMTNTAYSISEATRRIVAEQRQLYPQAFEADNVSDSSGSGGISIP
jgi:hypothetical protein